MVRLPNWMKFALGAGVILLIIINYTGPIVYYEKVPPHPGRCYYLNSSLDNFNNAKIPQDDPILVNTIKSNFICPPPKSPINLPPFNPNYYFDEPSGIVQQISDILIGLSPGFFIECGALDGIMASNTLWLERKLGWTGLLIEANQRDFGRLVRLNRKAWLSNFCLSTLPYPNKMNFYLAPEGGLPGVAALDKREQYNSIPVETQCMPLQTLLLALNRTTIDYFSLDVEGAEIKIMETIPFDKVIFKVFSLENGNPGGAPALKEFLEKRGYIFYKFGPADSIFLHSSLGKFITNDTTYYTFPN